MDVKAIQSRASWSSTETGEVFSKIKKTAMPMRSGTVCGNPILVSTKRTDVQLRSANLFLPMTQLVVHGRTASKVGEVCETC